MTRESTVIKIAETLNRSLCEKLEPHHRRGPTNPFLQEGTSSFGWGPTDPGFALIGAYRLSLKALLASYQVACVLPKWQSDSRGLTEDGGATLADLQAIHAAYPEEGGAQRQSVPMDGLVIYGAGYMCQQGITDRKLDVGAMIRLSKLDGVVFASGGYTDSWPLVEIQGSVRNRVAGIFGW